MEPTREFVKAGTAEASSGREIPATPMDTVAPIFNTQELYYKGRIDVGKARAGLRRALCRYPMASGRLFTESATIGLIRLCDGGAVFETAERDEPLPPFGPKNEPTDEQREAYRVQSPCVRAAGRGEEALMQIRITSHSCGGSVVGFTVHHMIMDGFSKWAFMTEWANGVSAAASDPEPPLPTAHDHGDRAALAALLDDRAAEAAGDSFLLPVGTPEQMWQEFIKLGTATPPFVQCELTATPDRLKVLKERASQGLPEGQWISTADALSAWIWRTVSALSDGRPQTLWTCHNLRGSCGPTVSEGYWGNCVAWLPIGTESHADGNLSSASLLHRTCLKTKTGLPLLLAKMRDVRTYYGRGEGFLSNARADTVDTVSINNYQRFPVYEIDLGGGCPFYFAGSHPRGARWWFTIRPSADHPGGCHMQYNAPPEKAAELERMWVRDTDV